MNRIFSINYNKYKWRISQIEISVNRPQYVTLNKKRISKKVEK